MSLIDAHSKLLAVDLLSLAQSPADPSVFTRNALRVSHVEIVGVVVSRESKPDRFLKFAIDDSTGLIPCVLWLNQLSSAFFSRRSPMEIRAVADMAAEFAARAELGALARVRGKISAYRGDVQVTVTDVVVERDSNSEILHWLDCVRLSRTCYARQK